MSDPIAIRIAPVRRRISLRRMARGAARGAVFGAWLAAIAGVVALLAANLSALVAGGALFFAAIFFFLVRAWRTSPTTLEAAKRVDVFYSLQDRTVSALQLAGTDGDPIVRLQREEAFEQLSRLVPAAVVPFKLPLMDLTKAALLLLLAFGLAAGAVWRSGRETAPRVEVPTASFTDAAQFRPVVKSPSSISPQIATASLPTPDEAEARDPADSSGWSRFIDQAELAHRYFDRLSVPEK